MEMGVGRYAVLLCAQDSEYVKKQYGGYFGVFRGMLEEEGETWEVYRVAAGEFPDDNDIDGYDGFVITGSCNDAHGDDPWIRKLLELLKRLDIMEKKILGICFGHQLHKSRALVNISFNQILCRALGGETGRASGWDIGVTTVKLSRSASKLFSSLNLPTVLSVIECHRDEILRLPSKAEVIASSDKTTIEMFKCGDHIMGIQGHPEYNRDIVLHLIDRLVTRSLIADSFADEVKANVVQQEPDNEAWKKLCMSFLKGRHPFIKK